MRAEGTPTRSGFLLPGLLLSCPVAWGRTHSLVVNERGGVAVERVPLPAPKETSLQALED